MKRILLAISLLLAVTGVQGAVQYEFRQIFHSDVDTMPSNDMAGRAVIDGDRFRVEFLSGTAFPAGSYMIGTNGARQQFWVDPSKKSYVEVNAAGVASSLGSRHITIANKKIDVTPMPDHPIVAGLPTDHYRMVMSYEITLPFGQILLKQNVTTVIDKWTTMAYAGVAEGFLGGIRTGNADLDELFDNENTKIKGFPLRQTLEITTVNANPRQPGSQLPLKQTHTQTRELTITAIESKANVAAALFQVPAGFHKADPLRDDTQKTPVHVLSMEPAQQ